MNDWLFLYRSVIRLTGPEFNGWFHLVQGQKTWRLRNFVEPQSDHSPELQDLVDDHALDRQLQLGEVAQLTGMPATTTRVDNEQTWAAILQQLQEVLDGPLQDGPPRDEPAGVDGSIPLTPIRSFYDCMKLFTSLESHLAIATELDRNPRRLAEMFQASLHHFSRYNNRESFVPEYPPRNGLQLAPVVRCTNDLTARLEADGRGNVNRDESLNFTYVEREIVTARTTGRAAYENGARATTGKRIDWLLSCEQDLTPIIAEVKVGDDKSPLYAVIQLLMYAAELATANQLARLRLHYNDSFATPDEAIDEQDVSPTPFGPISLYLVLCGYRYSPIREHLLERTRSLCQRLMAERQVGSVVRRFACLEASLYEGRLSFSSLFSFPAVNDE